MVVRTYSPTATLLHRRALVFAVLLLAGVTALAGSMTLQRKRDPLGSRFQPPGWRISFRIPKRWVPGMPIPSAAVTVFPFHGRASDGLTANLAVWEFAEQIATGAGEICAFILHKYGASSLESTDNPSPVTGSGVFGAREGVEAFDARGSTVVRAVMLEQGVGYAMSLSVEGTAIPDGLYKLFDLSCRSVQYVGM